MRRCKNCTNLRAKGHTTSLDPVINQLDPERVPGEHQPASPAIPYRQTEHAVEMIEYLIAPLLIPVDDDFRIGSGAEDVPICFQLAPELKKIVDLAIEDHPDGLFLVRHGLVATRKIDDREPSKTESERPCHVIALVIRASMDKALGHLLDVLTENRRLVTKIVLAANAAHKFFGPLEFSVDHCWRGHGRLGPLTGAV